MDNPALFICLHVVNVCILLSAVVNRVAIRTCVCCVQFFRFLSWHPERGLEKNFQMQSISEGSECIKIEEQR